MSAYGRKRTFGLSLNGCSLTAALEEKADIRVLELRARVNRRNRPEADIKICSVADGILCNADRAGEAEEVRMQSLNFAKLRQEFNNASDSVRLVAVFSPT